MWKHPPWASNLFVVVDKKEGEKRPTLDVSVSVYERLGTIYIRLAGIICIDLFHMKFCIVILEIVEIVNHSLIFLCTLCTQG